MLATWENPSASKVRHAMATVATDAAKARPRLRLSGLVARRLRSQARAKAVTNSATSAASPTKPAPTSIWR